MRQSWLHFALLCFSCTYYVCANEHCDQFVCGSRVSKCLLTGSCQCKLVDTNCCRECLHCLGDLYIECCNCLDMCPKQNDTLNGLATKSQIGDFDGVPEIYEALTAEEDEEKWTIMRTPVRAGWKRRQDITSKNSFTDAIERQASFQKLPHTINCTVIYLNVCKTHQKCAQYCENMGANSYRWFHNGCCECVGPNCLNYGINESLCVACPEEDVDIEVDDYDQDYGVNEDEMMWDYSEDEVNYN